MAYLYNIQCMNGAVETLEEMVSAVLYIWSTKDMTAVEAWNKGDERELTGKKKKTSLERRKPGRKEY